MSDVDELTLEHHSVHGTWCNVEITKAERLRQCLTAAGVCFSMDPKRAAELARPAYCTFVFGEYPPYRLADALLDSDWEVTLAPDIISTELSYSAPVDQLLGLGNTPGMPQRLDHLPPGITLKDVPELIRMAGDPELWTGSASYETGCGPNRAIALLGLLRAKSAIPYLLNLLRLIEEKEIMTLGEEIGEALGQIGADALVPLAAYLADASHNAQEQEAASEAVRCIAEHYPDSTSECIAVLSNQLTRFQSNSPWLNGWLISVLLDLKARPAIPLIEKAFAAGRVDSNIVSREEVASEFD